MDKLLCKKENSYRFYQLQMKNNILPPTKRSGNQLSSTVNERTILDDNSKPIPVQSNLCFDIMGSKIWEKYSLPALQNKSEN